MKNSPVLSRLPAARFAVPILLVCLLLAARHLMRLGDRAEKVASAREATSTGKMEEGAGPGGAANWMAGPSAFIIGGVGMAGMMILRRRRR